MPAKGARREKLVAGDKSHPQSLGTLLAMYLEALDLLNYSKETIKKRRLQLNAFVDWSELRSLTRVTEITRTDLERYQRQLPHELDRNGKPRSIRNQHERLMSIRSWFKWTAMLEVLYSTGIRRMELLNLKLADIDEERGVLTVRQGKGKRDRVVPIGQRALKWLNKYVDELRPKLLVNDDQTTVFLTRLGDQFSASSLSALVAEYVRKSGVAVEGSCHLFRHAMATAMHDRGADIRIVQEMLGHVKLDTTQIYTRVSIEKLKAIHSQTHPAFC